MSVGNPDPNINGVNSCSLNGKNVIMGGYFIFLNMVSFLLMRILFFCSRSLTAEIHYLKVNQWDVEG